MSSGQASRRDNNNGGVEIPREAANGDYAATHAMAAAREMKMAPRKIADTLAETLDLTGSYFGRCEVAGPGFINFFVSDKWYRDVLTAIEAEGPSYGESDIGNGARVMVEFVSANPTGPMTIGNARAALLGDTWTPFWKKPAITSGASFRQRRRNRGAVRRSISAVIAALPG
jgi:arginyl-tRNA synthetase